MEDPHGPGRTPRLYAALQRGRDDRLHLGAQAYISRGGQVVADFAIGEARAGVPMTANSLMLWRSGVKPIAAVAIAQLWERELLDLDDPVSRYWPEFGERDKAGITIRHILTHTGGFRGITGDWENGSWNEVTAAVARARREPNWTPGDKAGYHVASSWYALAEVIHRVDGRPYDRYVREEIFSPLGMHDSWVGLPGERYAAYGDRIAFLYRTDGPEPIADQFLDTPAGAEQARPGSNGRGPARELGKFYEMLLGKGMRNGARILRPQTVEAIISPHRVGMYDHTFAHVMDWSLGWIVNSARYGPETVPYGFGLGASPRTFGHGGSQSSISFADPEQQLVVVIVCNGTPGERRHQARMRELLGEMYADQDALSEFSR